jgi:hypothetical protein
MFPFRIITNISTAATSAILPQAAFQLERPQYGIKASSLRNKGSLRNFVLDYASYRYILTLAAKSSAGKYKNLRFRD